MKNLTNLIIKGIAILVVLLVLIPVFGKSTWTQTIITALVLMTLAYVAGDMWILPKFGNLLAVLADLGISALVLWGMSEALPQFVISNQGIWVISIVISFFEAVFHWYLLSTKAPEKK